MKLGVVGTGWIVKDFIKAIGKLDNVEVYSVYSRTNERGAEFSKDNNISHYFTDYDEMLKHIDIVYIGSPNSLHFGYAKKALENKIHTICEKPITSNSKELNTLINLSKDNDTVLMEAMMSISMPSYKAIKDNLNKLGKIRNVIFNFCQYSSKYDAYLRGETPNIFNPKFSTGALMDIGIYCVYPAIDLFGIPKDIQSSATYLRNKIDGSGVSIFNYEDFNVSLIYSKINNSYIKSEIMGENGSIIIDHISKPSEVLLYKNNGEIEVLFKDLDKDIMYYEAKEFINTIESKNIESNINSHKLSVNVMKILDKIREKTDIKFDADKI
jgi:scyllo-inositol 2-dehydrogenase (NADP+)